MFPPPLSENSTPHRDQHLGYILGHIVDLDNTLPSYQFWVTEPDGEFVGVVRELLFEGYLLMYDPMYNVAKWDPVHGMVNDLSPTEDSSARELSNITLLDGPDDVSQMDQFKEHHAEPEPDAALHTEAGDQEEEMEWDSSVRDCDLNVHCMEPESLEAAPLIEVAT